MSIRRGSRPSARTRAAPTSSRNSGWGSVGPALELGMGLGADPEGVAGQLDELDQPVVGRGPRAHQADLLEPAAEAGVHLVAVAVALGHHLGAVGQGHLRAGLEPGRVGAEAHGPALVDDVVLLVHQVDHRVAGGGVELPRVGPVEIGQGPGHLDDHDLQPEAEPEQGSSCSRA